MFRTFAIVFGKLVVVTLISTVVAAVAVVAYDEQEIRPRSFAYLRGEDLPDWALRQAPDYLSSSSPELIPVSAIDWERGGIGVIPVDRIGVIPVDRIDWKDEEKSYLSEGKEVKIVDLGDDEEVLIVRRGDSFSAYKVDSRSRLPGASRYSYSSRR